MIEREIRRKEADWRAIEALPPRIREAVVLFVETGDLRKAQHLAGMELERFVELLRILRIPPFITVIED